MGTEITFALIRRAHIGKNEIFKSNIKDATADEPQGWDPQPFAKDLRHGAVAPGRGRADIRPMRAQAGVAEEIAILKCRPNHIYVWQMAAAEIGDRCEQKHRRRARLWRNELRRRGLHPAWI